MMLKTIYLIFLGLTSGCMVAAGTFAFIAAIGIVPRMAKRTETQRFIRVYEDAIVLGGIWGTTAMFIRYRLPSVPLLPAAMRSARGFRGGACNGTDRGAECHSDSAAAHKADKGVCRGSFLRLRWGRCAALWVYFLVDGFYVL